ncbi:uncharacterized protein BX663DRAFT_435120 [Cokeromyces recurvatus]|uniref:uncharacterized protein n=1 Tax=Cokeromyces recurvatus TaxID=90255 RepID=UPI00221E68B4|nr:uncharacterized protein BX663DRAFT_435120 [Cokeromyces recurvatus]KAI7902576.1 hypothetical protein BX663DRAFT_435120 [Cokeromyces recurvatus]
MITSNLNIKSIYDSAHNLAFEKLLKPMDIDKRLYLSALFQTPQSSNPIDRRYLVPLRRLPNKIIRYIRAMEQAMEHGTVINIQGVSLNTVDEVALHHILVGIYLNHSKPPKRISSEIDFIVKSVADLLCSLWSSHNDVTISWDFSTWINKQKMPDSISTRPDLVFYSDFCEVGNGEIKPIGTPKSCVDVARARILETCKRQLHIRLKTSTLPSEAITFGVLIYVSFSDGYYPYERVSVGILPTSFDTYKNAEKTLMDLIQLKESMNMSLPTESTSEEFILVDKNFLLPTVSYSSIVKYN